LFFLMILFRSYGLIKSFLAVVPLTAVDRRPVRATRPRPSATANAANESVGACGTRPRPLPALRFPHRYGETPVSS